MNFAKRVTKLEQLLVPKRLPRIVLRYEGPGSERFPQPTQGELNEAWLVLSMQFVPAKDGRPVDSKHVGESRREAQMTAGDRR